MGNTKPRITLRLTPNQMLVLEELKDTLGAPISLIIRAIVGDWLTQHEDVLERIISGEQKFNKDFLNKEEYDEE